MAWSNEIRPHDGSQELGRNPPEHEVPVGGFGGGGRLLAKFFEEGMIDDDLLQPREKRNKKQKGARSKRASRRI